MIATAITTEKFTECPKCSSTNLIRQTGEDEPTKHYGRLTCGDCGKFVTWIKDPCTTLNTHLRSNAIKQILTNFEKTLTSYEYEFLISNLDKRFLTVKQQKYLNAIACKTLGYSICMTEKPKNNPTLDSEVDAF